MFRIITRGISSFLKGGWFSVIGTCGAFLGEDAAIAIKNMADYVYFNAENGYLKDNPGKENESVIKRLWEVMR